MFPDQTPYQYGYNNPVHYKDPSGLANETDTRANSKGGSMSITCQACGAVYDTPDDPLNPTHRCKGGGGGSQGGGGGGIGTVRDVPRFGAGSSSTPDASERTLIGQGSKNGGGGPITGSSGLDGSINIPQGAKNDTYKGNGVAANPNNWKQTHLHRDVK